MKTYRSLTQEEIQQNKPSRLCAVANKKKYNN